MRDFRYFKEHDQYAYCIREGGKAIYDNDVADFVVKHLKLLDRLNPYKVAIATMYAHPMLMGDFEIPKKKKWTFDEYFKTDGFGFWKED